MAKLALKSAPASSPTGPSPSPDEITVVDERGRTIGVRRMRMSIRRQVLQRLDPALADREKFLGMVMLAACCTSIDGDPVRMPVSTSEWEFLIDRLDDDGFTAMAIGIGEHFAPKSQAEVVAEAKN